jgi:hypothetical protein
VAAVAAVVTRREMYMILIAVAAPSSSSGAEVCLQVVDISILNGQLEALLARAVPGVPFSS